MYLTNKQTHLLADVFRDEAENCFNNNENWKKKKKKETARDEGAGEGEWRVNFEFESDSGNSWNTECIALMHYEHDFSKYTNSTHSHKQKDVK